MEIKVLLQQYHLILWTPSKVYFKNHRMIYHWNAFFSCLLAETQLVSQFCCKEKIRKYLTCKSVCYPVRRAIHFLDFWEVCQKGPFLRALSVIACPASCSSLEDASSQTICTHSGTEAGSLWLQWCLLLVSLSSPLGFWKPLQYKFSHLELVSGKYQEMQETGTSLVVQWLRLRVPNAGLPSLVREPDPTRPNKSLHAIAKDP